MTPVLDLNAVSLITSGQRLLDNVNLRIGRAERVAVVGASGVGKSMLMRVALGLCEPLSGRTELFGEDLADCDLEARRRLRRQCGVSFQGGSLIRGLTVDENLWLALTSPAAARPRLRRKLDRIGFEFGIDHLFATPVDTLSQGQARMVELARAFVHDPEFVMLDGPLEEMPSRSEFLEKQLQRHTVIRPRAMLLITQNEDVAFRVCERVYRLEEGRLLAQSTVRSAIAVPGTS
ncbi:ATP-binding cassette domain-containing protein [Novosphingobium sp. MMS21-SN21R]|uniref:ATP-binding cassette domain-containing protein n=1 Tax=Novosphingobium sp. MMS21-SN21R TaxID=2969298 RepID=UPI0028863315|nr:ATP-binding cassette domain-containing protein [Novosphingobium sp. MMS21-SN21R]MDT0506967.1 ATP-binding cassette domain-containing protein [Novosphingobium sp. MMS21-SN21R]